MQRFLALPKYEPVRIEEHGERIYVTPIGRNNSVTNILSGTRDESGLLMWRENVGEERANFICDFAKFRGNHTHESIERFLINGTEPSFSFATTPYWKSIRIFLKRVRHSLVMEGALWHPDGFAGTMDCIAYLDDDDSQPTLLDWKTADSPRDKQKMYEYSLQAAAYTQAANYVYGPLGLHITRAMVVVALPNQQPQVTELSEDDIRQSYLHFKSRIERFTYARKKSTARR